MPASSFHYELTVAEALLKVVESQPRHTQIQFLIREQPTHLWKLTNSNQLSFLPELVKQVSFFIF